MLTGLHLENYGTFVNVDWDFGSSVQPVVALYGENGAGKTQLLKAIAQMSQSTQTLIAKLAVLNADEQPSQQTQPTNLTQLFRSAFTIDATGDSVIHLDFGASHYYELIFDEGHHLKQETLYTTLKQRSAVLLQVTRADGQVVTKFHHGAFSNEALNRDLKRQLQRWWGEHTALSVLALALADDNQQFLHAHISAPVWQALATLQQLNFAFADCHQWLPQPNLLTGWIQGTITEKQQAQLAATEHLLNGFFPALYSDIEQLYYRQVKSGDHIDYQLIIQKHIWGQVREVPFELESDGTKKLLRQLPLIAAVADGQTVIIDELDTGVHDLLVVKVIATIADQLTGQLLFSTHNTTLLKAISPKSVYVIQEAHTGEKYVAPITAVRPIKANNNVQKMYLNGDFMGIPYAGFLDLNEIFGVDHDER